MKIGEIAVVGPADINKKTFLSPVCSEVQIASQTMVFGRVPVGDNLLLHVYGIDVIKNPERYAWDLVTTRLSGFIVLYHWYVRRSFEAAQAIIDYLYDRYDIPFVIAANAGSRPIPVPSSFHTSGITLSGDCKFVFWRTNNMKTIRRVYTTLFDTLIDRTPDTFH